MDVFKVQGFDEPVGAVAVAGVLPGRDVGEIFVVAGRLALLGLKFLAEVAAGRLPAFQGIEADEFTQLQDSQPLDRPFRVTDSDSSPSPSTRTSFQNSSRSTGIFSSAVLSPCSLRAMPQ